MSDRDPRVDPQTGDVLRSVHGETRKVTLALGNHVLGGVVDYWLNYRSFVSCRLKTWRRWCRDHEAQVIVLPPTRLRTSRASTRAWPSGTAWAPIRCTACPPGPIILTRVDAPPQRSLEDCQERQAMTSAIPGAARFRGGRGDE